MFTKILIANRGESGQSPLRRSQNGREADVSAQPNCAVRAAHAANCLVRAAHAGEFPAENQHV